MCVAQVAVATQFAVSSFLISAKCPLHGRFVAIPVTTSHDLCSCSIREDPPVERALVEPARARSWPCSLQIVRITRPFRRVTKVTLDKAYKRVVIMIIIKAHNSKHCKTIGSRLNIYSIKK